MSAGAGTLLASGYFEVHHLDDDHTNNSPENLITACPFCHQVFHAGNAGHSGKASKVIWLPWLSQAKLNLLCHTLFVAMIRGEVAEAASDDMNEKDRDLALLYASWATSLYYALLAQSSLLESHLGQGLSQPQQLAMVIMRLGSAYANREVILRHARLVPEYKYYRDHAKYWSQYNFQGLPSSTWQAIADKIKDER